MENTIIIKKERIWELDLARGFACIMMLWDHLCWDLGYVFRDLYKNEVLINICKWCRNYAFSTEKRIINFIFCVGIFIFVAGITSNITRNNIKRSLKVIIVAFTLTLGSILLQLLCQYLDYKFFSNLIIYFGIFHSIGLMMLLSPLFVKLKPWINIIIGVIVIALGYILHKYITTDNISILIIFNILPNSGFSTPDYVPLFPLFGVYLFGMAFGKVVYKNKKSLFKKKFNCKFIEFIGRNSLPFYFIHQIILILLLLIFILVK